VDLTGAVIADTQITECLVDLGSALRLLGIPMALSGIRPEIARLLAPHADAFADIRTYRTLAAALAAWTVRGRGQAQEPGGQ
jgi:hypothetical protein